MFRRPRTARPHLLTLALVALCGVLVQSALAASAPRDSGNSARPNRSVESIRWQGAQYTSISELRAHVVRRGGNWERFLRTRPAVVRAYGLRPVRWDGRSFYSRSGLTAWLHARGKSYNAWARQHASGRARLTRNAGAVLRRRGAVESFVTPSGFPAVADTFVDSTKSNTSFGQAARLSVETPRTKHAYVRFDVGGLTSPVKKATLHLYSEASGSAAIEVWEITGDWSETSTWKSRPTLGRQLPGELSVAGRGTWASVEVTPFVTGNGRVDLAFVARSGKRAASFASREARPAAVLTIESATAAPLTDTQAPTAPAALRVTGQSETSVALSWSPSTDDVGVVGYGQSRGGTRVGTTTGTSYTFTGLSCGTSYSLSVDAHDAAGNRSEQASVIAATSTCATRTTAWTRLFGFSNGNRKSSQDELRQSVGIGATLLRVDAQWAYMEPSRGSYDWSSWDTVVANARATGGKLIACIAYTPAWARPAGTTIFQEPSDSNEADYARFAAAFASRYAESGVLAAIEIWNEPNLSAFWKPRPNPAKYTRMLQLAYAAVKQAAPGVEVMTAGLSPAGSYASHPLGGDSVNPVRFLEAIYANGGQGEFDSVGHHPYDFGGAPTTTHDASAWYQMFGTSPSLRSLMERNGDGAKRIHATEFGIPSAMSAYGHTFSEEKQRQMIDASVRAWKTYPWAGHFAVYLQKDGINGGGGTWFYHYGIQKADGTPKPAWWAFRDAIG